MHGPLQAPREYVDKYQGIRNMRRRRYAAMVDIVDEAIGNVTQTMKEAGYVAIVLSFTFYRLLLQAPLHFVDKSGNMESAGLDEKETNMQQSHNSKRTVLDQGVTPGDEAGSKKSAKKLRHSER